MKKQILYICLACIAIAGCKKRDDFKGEGTLRGKLSIYNPYAGEKTTYPLAGKPVHLAYSPSDTLNFLYTVMTDAEGYFSFTNLSEDSTYDLFYEDSIEHVSYSAFFTAKPSNNTVDLRAQPDENVQNGLNLTVRDNSGGLLQGASISAYNSMLLYTTDSATNSDNGKVYAWETGKYGTFTKLNIPAGKYYFIARKNVGNLQLIGYGSIEVGAAGVRSADISLSQPGKGFDLLVWDDHSTPVNAAKLLFYGSYVAFMSDTLGTNKIFEMETDNNGRAKKADIGAGKYYIRASKTITGIASPLVAMDSIIVNYTGITLDTITIK